MKSEITLPAPADTAHLPAAARLALRLLTRLQHGTLELTLPDGQRQCFGAGAPRARLTLRDWTPAAAAWRSGDIGFAETYIGGAWSSDDLVALLRLFARNRTAVESVIYGSFWGGLIHRFAHWLRRNSKVQAKRNIQAHYDLGNAFYELWLDPSMTYSSALFVDAPADPQPPASAEELAAAQRAKYKRVLEQLRLAPGSRVLEIGCGWGGFAAMAARAGHAVKGLTLSPAQLQYARARLQAQGLQAEFALQDYRDERGRYDGIASIEMFEA
ncbi:MAG TPA: class I SAM-dependent methyltransferase, partial [Burkholderiaceae bacterium]|nr:class I SAM-dependent methyltransferase [Burkholderiaceae bacterium]